MIIPDLTYQNKIKYILCNSVFYALKIFEEILLNINNGIFHDF